MHLIFLNPQGNFDKNDSHLTEHADFGGQLIYVKEVCVALVNQYPDLKVDIVTRRFQDPEWSNDFAEPVGYYENVSQRLRIVRISCGGTSFLRKELLWEHLQEWVENIVSFYGDQLPDFATAHYGDGGYTAVLLKQKTGIPFTLTAHSLGAQKLDKLFDADPNFEKIDTWYHFSQRIHAERLSMQKAGAIITSTCLEKDEQYGHPLYRDVVKDEKFTVIPPGVNMRLFNQMDDETDRKLFARIERETGVSDQPVIILSSRLEDKKNHITAVKAYAGNKELQQKARLAIFIRGIKNPYEEVDSLPEKEQKILKTILHEIDVHHLREQVFFLDLRSQKELAGAYKYFAKRKSVFLLTAFYEPFGLAPIEAGACGLVPVTTKNGGPGEIFKDDVGILVDPADPKDTAGGLIKALENHQAYAEKIISLVKEKYTWEKTAEAYLHLIQGLQESTGQESETIPTLNAQKLILDYLNSR